MKMIKKIIETKNAPKPLGPYSQAVQVGNLLFCSGQIPINPETNEVLKGSVSEQTLLVLKNIKAVLNEAGGDFENVVKTTMYLQNMNDFAVVNEIYGKHFTGKTPARTTIQVAALPKGVDVEIEVIAHI
jgi:2-iminobutanoate/2-iminopropanoate deaminase